MQKRMKFRPGYFLFAAVFSTCASLIYLSVPVYMMIVYDKVLFSFSRSTLYTLSAGLLIALLAVVLMGFLRRRMLAQSGDRLVREMEPFVVETMRRDTAGTQTTGYTRGLEDLETVRNAAAAGQLYSFLELPWMLVYLAVLVIIHPLVGILGIFAVFLAGVFHLLLGMAEKKRYTAADAAFAHNVDFVKTCLFRPRVLSGMQMLPAMIKEYRRRQTPVFSTRAKADNLHAWISTVIRLIQLSGPAVVFGAGVFVFFAEEITQGEILAAVIIGMRLFFCLERQLANMKSSITAAGAYRRLRSFVDVQKPEEKLSLPEPEGKFTAEGITLALAGRPILYNISFDLAPGEMLGILGPSSAGKTSLCRVMLGIWPPSAGKIRLDGAEIPQWPEQELGRYVGYLPQKPVLFPVSVAQNIARLQEPEPGKVVAAAKKAGVHEMVLSLANGYDTLIEGTGDNLSAGQCQGICLARALYDDPKLLVLDEPHTHLDDQGLQMLLQCLGLLKSSSVTTVVVSDRPKILMHTDKLLMIKEGRPAMYGPANEVLAQLSNRQPPSQAAGV
ncbi:MAG: ATP-binding cassette domain-containing protein [Desulfotignum sp.]|nr:ATP-binding cassette domain-containing protein [Desulfotignum sp.]